MLVHAHYMSGDFANAEKAEAAGLAAPNLPLYLYYLYASALLKESLGRCNRT